MHDDIVEFIKSGAHLHSVEPLDDLGGQVPPECLESLQAAFDAKRSEIYRLTKQDAISRRVSSMEADWRRQQMSVVAELIGDIPRYAIGTELRGDGDDNMDPGLSLERLLSDIEKLPRIGMANSISDSNSEAEERNIKVLNEYSNLRKELILKSKAIKLGTRKLKESDNQLSKIRYLLESIREKQHSTGDVIEYFTTYDDQLRANLEELRNLLEEAIKRSDDSAEKRLELQEILKMVLI